MRLDISIKHEHTDITTAVAWSPDCQLLSTSDDKVICKWGAGADGEGVTKLTTINAFVSSLAFFPSSGKQVSETYSNNNNNTQY